MEGNEVFTGDANGATFVRPRAGSGAAHRGISLWRQTRRARKAMRRKEKQCLSPSLPPAASPRAKASVFGMAHCGAKKGSASLPHRKERHQSSAGRQKTRKEKAVSLSLTCCARAGRPRRPRIYGHVHLHRRPRLLLLRRSRQTSPGPARLVRAEPTRIQTSRDASRGQKGPRPWLGCPLWLRPGRLCEPLGGHCLELVPVRGRDNGRRQAGDRPATGQ